MDEPLAELAACFRGKVKLPDQVLIRLTAAARAAGGRASVALPKASMPVAATLRISWPAARRRSRLRYPA